MPDNILDSDENWEPDTKETFVCHAELNAVLNRGANDVTGCKMYVTYYPCSNCAKVIIQSGVKEVVYYDMYSDKRKKDGEAAKKMLQDAKVDIM
ncbi:hypothetical protein FSP39_005519 [Pinctada imbricata]|uniref:dCMP deaminase n=1 Tax=Pinctada imbricata TaxID=66713 RepID=A0AA88YHF1_PINIB|nr:hypothetical protein FSP39_005519 [Pinctada imbricata]